MPETRWEKVQRIFFKEISESNCVDSDVKDLSCIDKAIAFNKERLSILEKGGHLETYFNLKKRLDQRNLQLLQVKSLFTELNRIQSGFEFLGLIGWGDGCLSKSLTSGQNISAVEGFVYRDVNGHLHAQRLGTCFEYFSQQLDAAQALDKLILQKFHHLRISLVDHLKKWN